MSILLFAAMAMAQAPTTAPPVQPPVKVKKQKPKQICEYLEITGSRQKQRVCRDAEGNLDLGPGVSNSAFGKTKVNQPDVSTGGPGSL